MTTYSYDKKTGKYISSDGSIMGGGNAYKQDDGSRSLTKPKTTTTKDTSNKNTTTKSTSTTTKVTSTPTKITSKGDYTSNLKTNSNSGSQLTAEKKNQEVSASNVPANSIQNRSKGESEWDYKANISKDKDRIKELVYNVKQYAEENPQLFKNQESFKEAFHYNDRDASQQAVLKAAWENYNKYGLNATENSVADSASEINTKKANEMIAATTDAVLQKRANAKNIIDSMQPQYQKLYNAYEAQLSKAMGELSDLKKMAATYYNNMTNMYNEQSAGEEAAMASQLSAQGLGYTAIGSSTRGVANHWATRYNDLLNNHLDRMTKLSETGNTIVNTIIPNMKNLTDAQKDLLTDYTTSLNGWIDDINNEVLEGIDNNYKPYEAIANSKVSAAAENAGSQTSRDTSNSSWLASNDESKVQFIYNKLGAAQIDMKNKDVIGIIQKAIQQYPLDATKAYEAARSMITNTPTQSSSNKGENNNETEFDNMSDEDLWDWLTKGLKL